MFVTASIMLHCGASHTLLFIHRSPSVITCNWVIFKKNLCACCEPDKTRNQLSSRLLYVMYLTNQTTKWSCRTGGEGAQR